MFNGVGLLKENELKLLVNDSVKPVAQLVRRIPYRLREKVNKKLDQLLELHIIEQVPKSNGEVKVCVYLRLANEAII